MLPLKKPPHPNGKYDIYPTFILKDNKIFKGYKDLAARIANNRLIVIDGYNGVGFDFFRNTLDRFIKAEGISCSWKNTSDYFQPGPEIRKITAPFLGDDDPLFGTRTTLTLDDFLVKGKIRDFKPDTGSDITILIGPGASLISPEGFKVYIDLPKNEIQYISRAGKMTNLGLTEISDPKEMYKYFYFVEWVVLNQHKKNIIPLIDLFVDGQRIDDPVWIEGDTLRESLHEMSRNTFRVRPWFEAGTWGGNWIKNNIEGLNKDVPNYAWSFELITPENGIILESSSLMLELSFDCLMFLESEAVLGDCHSRFGNQFPIRFDFLDTFDGGNLSVQCHPQPEYMKSHFGEDFTQEESYYILDTKDDAIVYLGFCNNIVPADFRKALEESNNSKTALNPDKYILRHHVNKHDLFLIPYGTIHGSGMNNLVLEISSTPYIFTFKMYDWLRPDLDGNPRPLNISRGMENLYFERKGDYVKEKLISKPLLISEDKNYRKYHLPTHETHLYDVHRYHIITEKEIETENKCLVMNLVEGSEIEIVTMRGMKKIFSYAETFVVPAAAEKITVYNMSATEAIIITAFIK